jgi:hypothetical protein
MHEDGVAGAGAGHGIALLVDHRVELLAAPGREREMAVWNLDIGQFDHAELGAAVRRREGPAGAKVRATVLNLIAGIA